MSCTPTRTAIDAEAPQAQYPSMPIPPPLPSTLSIPIDISLDGLSRSVNESLKGLIYEDNDFTDNGGDNLKVKVWKEGTIRITASGPDAIQYNVPLRLQATVRYGAFGATTTQEVSGSIDVTFVTNFEVLPTWDLVTLTKILNYRWIKTPTLKVLGRDLGVGLIANSLLKYNRSLLERTVDAQIRENINIEQEMNVAWRMMHDPIKLDDTYNAWLKLTPMRVAMSPLTVRNNTLSSIIQLRAIAEVSLDQGQPQPTPLQPLPRFDRPDALQDSFEIALTTHIPYTEAENVAKSELVGQTFTHKKRKVTIQDLRVYGEGQQVVIGVLLSGSVTGNIYLRGRPEYDHATQTVNIVDVDFDLDTKSRLLQSAGWLFHSTILKKMAPYLSFPLTDQLTEARQLIQQELSNYTVMPGVTLKGQLNQLTPQGLYITAEGFQVRLTSTGLLRMRIDKLEF